MTPSRHETQTLKLGEEEEVEVVDMFELPSSHANRGWKKEIGIFLYKK